MQMNTTLQTNSVMQKIICKQQLQIHLTKYM